jgi:hypothetical protein
MIVFKKYKHRTFSIIWRIFSILFFVVFFSAHLNAQIPLLSKEEMHKDLDQLNRYMKKWHPGYYAYANKEQMQIHYALMKDLCADSLSLREFRNVLRKTVGKVGCGHISVFGRKSAAKSPPIPLIPVKVKILEDRLFVVSCEDSLNRIKPKEEIISIEGVASNEWINSMKELSLSDGYNQTHKTYSAEINFAVFIYYLLGHRDKFILKLKDHSGEIYETVLFAKIPVSPPNTILNESSRKSILNESGIHLQKLDGCIGTYLLDVDHFTGKGQGKWFRQVFKILKSDHCQNLIIDLRGNGGGNVFKGNIFLAYLLDQPVRFFTFHRRLSLTPFNPKFKASFLERITPILFCLNPIQFPGRHGWYHSFPFFKKNKYHFGGQIYLLTNGGTFSMASYVTSHLKHQRNAIVIGEETGGNEYACRGMASGTIQLSNSGLRVGLNIYQLTTGLRLTDTGHGVMPHHSISYKPEDWLNYSDLELRRALELIHNK